MSRPKKTLGRRLYMGLTRPFAKRLPYTSWGDKLAYLHGFYSQHHRWPSDAKLFNDMLYRIKSGPEIERPERTFTSDKELVKYYVAGVVSESYNVPTIAVLRSAEEVENYDFPESCVVKPTHGCGGVFILEPGQEADRNAMISELEKQYYFAARERNYRSLEGKLIVEPLLFDGQDVHDYKVFCTNGEARCILYVNDRNATFYRLYLDLNWEVLPIEVSPYDVPKPPPDRPAVLGEMIDVAQRLSRLFDFVRVDFYIDRDKLLVGEITHCHWGANDQFRSIEDEKLLSRYLWPEQEDGSESRQEPKSERK